VRVLPISDKYIEDAEAAAKKLTDIGARVSVDRASEKLGAKIRLARLDRVPYMLVIGAQEAESNTVSVRHRDRMDLGARPLDEFIKDFHTEISSRSL
jgi:threonyl-tRNA synthetase